MRPGPTPGGHLPHGWAGLMLLIPLIGGCQRPVDQAASAPQSFSIVVLPDSQSYVDRSPLVFSSQVHWIARHIHQNNIAFVSHLGDVVERDCPEQWSVADRILTPLDRAVPYGLAFGNHDLGGDSHGAHPRRRPFGTRRFLRQPWYGGGWGDNACSYQLFSACGLDFVVVHLVCNAPDEALGWADHVLERHADRRAIVVTHMYLGLLARDQPARGRCRWSKLFGSHGNTPQQMWEKCFRRHPNVFLILCGDQSGVQAFRQSSRGEHGNRVHEVLSDYGRDSRGLSGYLRIYRFRPRYNVIEVQTYSPYRHRFCEGTPLVPDREAHAFALPYCMTRTPWTRRAGTSDQRRILETGEGCAVPLAIRTSGSQ